MALKTASPEVKHRHAELMKSRYRQDKERLRQRIYEWRTKHPERYNAIKRRSHLKHAYGLTLDQYDAMLAEQGGKCWICEEKPKKNALAVDHCHDTGKIRKLLCSHCNGLVGMIEKNPERFAGVLHYIEMFGYREPEN